MKLKVLLAVSAAMCGVWAEECPGGFWQSSDGTECLRTDVDLVMTLSDAEAYCASLAPPGRLFLPKADNTGILKTYADETFLVNPDLWERYWVGLTKDLSDAWQRHFVDSQGGEPYCVALDYRRPVNIQLVSFYGYETPTCRSDVQLPAICSVQPPQPLNAVSEGCPDSCPPCPAPTCPPVQPCQNVMPPPPPVLECPPTWFIRQGHCYHFLIASKTWQEASSSCQKDGAQLVSVADKGENDYLAVISDDLSETSPTIRRYWIGLNDRLEEGLMTWVGGEPLGFTAWGPRQPSINKKRRYEENCVVINSQSPGAWDDILCSRRHPYICKRAAEVVNS